MICPALFDQGVAGMCFSSVVKTGRCIIRKMRLLNSRFEYCQETLCRNLLTSLSSFSPHDSASHTSSCSHAEKLMKMNRYENVNRNDEALISSLSPVSRQTKPQYRCLLDDRPNFCRVTHARVVCRSIYPKWRRETWGRMEGRLLQ